ncbi:MAG: hypothetical protein QME79_12920 [Bacillota bacterium]|nr:hypothetical protein [Bacillota bacterium]
MAFHPALGCRIRAILGYNELAVPPLEEGRHALGDFTLEYEEAGRDEGSVEVKSRLLVTATREEAVLSAFSTG